MERFVIGRTRKGLDAPFFVIDTELRVMFVSDNYDSVLDCYNKWTKGEKLDDTDNGVLCSIIKM